MQVFRVRLGTAFVAAASDEELAAAFTLIAAAGGTEISVVRDQSSGRPRAEFAIEAIDRPSAVTTVDNLLIALIDATPSIAGGWVMTALVATNSQ
jgi:hypothetical protein